MDEIGIVTATHPGRDAAMMTRACRSVWRQTLRPAGHFVANDVKHQGAAMTRQAALEANPYEWTAFLDSDDWFDVIHLERLMAAAKDTGADYVYSWYYIAYGTVGQEQVFDTDPVFPPTHFTEPWNPDDPRHTTITVMVKTELAREVGFVTVDSDGNHGSRKGEDWEFTLGCNRLGTIYHLPMRTWFWHHHGRNSSGVPGYGDA